MSFVSGKGNDANDCATHFTACRSFQRAFNQAADGGEIKAIDAASYGPLAIVGKSISVTGVEGAGIFRTSGDAITIGVGNGTVTLANLTLDGNKGNARDGIRLAAAGRVVIKNCKISNFSGVGINLATATKFLIEDVVVSNNSTFGGSLGINVASPVGPSLIGEGIIRRATVVNNSQGLKLVWGRATVSDSMFSGNSGDAIHVGEGDAEGVVRLERSDVTGNGVGINVAPGGFAYSGKDNFILSNGTNFIGNALIQWGKQ